MFQNKLLLSLIVVFVVGTTFILYFTGVHDSSIGLQKSYLGNGERLKDQINLFAASNGDAAAVRYVLIITKKGPNDKMLVNGTSPGPTLKFLSNTSYELLVINEIGDDYSTVHLHGFQQIATPYSDGPIGVTQCPIAYDTSKNSFLYTFITPSLPGAYFYHGHYKEQQTDGLYGGIIVDDTVTDNDDWVFLIADYYEQPAAKLLPYYLSPNSSGDEPLPDDFIVNGIFSGHSLQLRTNKTGKHTAHFINAGSFSMYNVSIDGLPLIVTNIDGTPVDAVAYTSVVLNVAQRVTVELDFSQLALETSALSSSPSIWVRVQAQESMYPQYDATEEYSGLIGRESF